TAELRPFRLNQSDMAKKVVWLTSAPEGQVLEVGLLYVPFEAPVHTELPTDGEAQVVCAGRLADARQVLLVVLRPVPVSPVSSKSKKGNGTNPVGFTLA